jgi:hypothetical protein
MKTKRLLTGIIAAQLFFAGGLFSQVATAALSVNNIRATVAADGILFMDGYNSQTGYEVPKNSGQQAMYAAGIWIGGFDANGTLHTSAMTYRQSGADFSFGLLDTISLTCTNSTNSNLYNNVWELTCHDLDTFLNNQYISTNVSAWPGNGDIAMNQGKFVAPFTDVDGDGVYNPSAGDIPKLKGDKMLFSVINDKCTSHTETNALPFGVEVHCSAYGYYGGASSDTAVATANTTFYHYKIINFNSYTFYNTMISFFADPDLGNSTDDRIGSNLYGQFGYVYNDSVPDSQYGSSKMMLSFVPLRGAVADAADGINNDRDSLYDPITGIALGPNIDELGEECIFSKCMYYLNNTGSVPAAMTAPANANEYYQYMNGRWKDSTSLTMGGNGYGGGIPVSHAFGGSATSPAWTEMTGGLAAGDRRLLISSGPFTLDPGETNELEFAIVYSHDQGVQWNTPQFFASAEKDVRIIKHLYSTQSFPYCASSISSGIKSVNGNDNDFSIYPNPANNFITLQLPPEFSKTSFIRILDATGREISAKKIVNITAEKIDVSSLARGIYFVQVSNGQSFAVKKFVKE